MMQIGLIGIGAGAAAALLFASVTSGVWLSIPLFYLAPLPIMIAGAWLEPLGGADRRADRRAGARRRLRPVFFFTFLAGAGLPAWWLGYLAMLARPVGNGGAPALEWYPPGRLVIWAAILAALVVIVAIPNFGTDAESFRAGLRNALMHVLRVETDAPADAALTLARRDQCRPAGRLPGGRHSAGGGGAGDHHQRVQSVARRAHREIFRPAETAVAAACGHEFSAPAHRGAGARGHRELSSAALSASSPACCRRAC